MPITRGSDTALEHLKVQPGAASQERFNAMASTHDEMVSDLVDHKLLSSHGQVNEDSTEKEMQNH
eukprot:898400-Amphidinium_carterae.4